MQAAGRSRTLLVPCNPLWAERFMTATGSGVPIHETDFRRPGTRSSSRFPRFRAQDVLVARPGRTCPRKGIIVGERRPNRCSSGLSEQTATLAAARHRYSRQCCATAATCSSQAGRPGSRTGGSGFRRASENKLPDRGWACRGTNVLDRDQCQTVRAGGVRTGGGWC
jgi:hypothetical protein